GEGQIAAAYEHAFSAAALAKLAREAAELDNICVSQGLDPMIARLNASSTTITRFDAVRQKLEAEDPRTASDTIALMDAFSNLSVAQGMVFQARSAIATLQNNPDATEDDV